MFELFLVVCALTALDCDSIYVRYGNTGGFDDLAIAGIGESGAYHIVIKPSMRQKPDWFIRNLLIHEVAHLVVLDKDPTNTTHNEQFQIVCRDLAKRAGSRSHKQVCDSHSGTRSVWQRVRRRE